VKFSEFESDNSIVFKFFDNLKEDQRDESLKRALYIGILALVEDRLSAFFSKTQNELGTQLESLKMTFELKKELFYTGTGKGVVAEQEICDALNQHFQKRGIKDVAELTGTTQGNLPRNKTGDIVCLLNDRQGVRIVIECKFDRSLKLGDVSERDVYMRQTDTAWSQLLEARANRDAKLGIIVFDDALVDPKIKNTFENIGFIDAVGFVAIVDSQRNDYTNLFIAYHLARDIALRAKPVECDPKVLALMLKRIIKDIEGLRSIKRLVDENIANCRSMLSQIEKSMLSIEFTAQFINRFFAEGNLNEKELMNFYLASDLKGQLPAFEDDLASITQ